MTTHEQLTLLDEQIYTMLTEVEDFRQYLHAGGNTAEVQKDFDVVRLTLRHLIVDLLTEARRLDARCAQLQAELAEARD